MAFFGSAPSKAAAPSFSPFPTKQSNPLFEEAPQTSSSPLFGSTPATPTGPAFGAAPATSSGSFFGSSAKYLEGVTFDFSSDAEALSSLGQFSLETPDSDDLPTGFDGDDRSLGLLQSTGASVADIEAFVGLESGALDALTTNYTPTNGAVVKFTLPTTGESQTLDVIWNFMTGEFNVNTYDDFAFFATSDGQVGLLSRSIDVGSNGSTGWKQESLSITLDDTPAFIAFGVLNVQDQAVNSYLGVDSIELMGVGSAGTPFFSEAPDSGTSFFG